MKRITLLLSILLTCQLVCSQENASEEAHSQPVGGSVTFMLDSVTAYTGDTVLISLRPKNFGSISTFSSTILYNPAVVDYISFAEDSLTGIVLNENQPGELSIDWSSAELFGESLEDSVSILKMRFELIGQPGEMTHLLFSDTPTDLQYGIFTTFGGWDYDTPDTISGQIHILGNTVDLLEEEINELRIYPNPTTDVVWIQSTNNSSFQCIEVFSTDGKLVRRWANIQIGNCSIPLPNKPGAYFIRSMFNDGTSQYSRILKH